MNRIITVTLNPAIDHTLSIPGFAVGRVNRVHNEQVSAGGKGVNVAAVLAGLGAGVVATGVLGEENAELFETCFRAKSIEDQFVRVSGRTRVGLKIIDPRNGLTTDVNFAGSVMPESVLDQLRGRLEMLVRPRDWVVLAGSVPGGVDSMIYARLAEAVTARGGFVALDTSGEPLRHALGGSPAFVKPNADELTELLGRPIETLADRLAATRELVTRYGVQTAALSMGGDGAIFANKDGALLAKPPAVRVCSTVGAGDAMVAGAVFALSHGDSLGEVARLATALGSDAVTRVGAGVDAARSFEALLKSVVLETL